MSVKVFYGKWWNSFVNQCIYLSRSRSLPNLDFPLHQRFWNQEPRGEEFRQWRGWNEKSSLENNPVSKF